MSDLNEDKTVAFHDQTAFDTDKPTPGGAAVIDVPKARLVCLETVAIEGSLPGDGIIHLIPGSEQTIGRGEVCTYPIPSRKLSRQHARVFPGVGSWGVEDLNSTNGIQVNRQKIKTAWLTHGDEVRFGPIPFRFELERPEMTEAALARARAAAPVPEEGDEERTMMVGSLGAGRAVIAAVRQAAPPIEDIAPPRREPEAAAAKPAAKGGRLPLLIGAGIVLCGLIGAGVYLAPGFFEAQRINDVVEAGAKVANQVMARARELGAAAVDEATLQRDLGPLGTQADTILNHLRDKPTNVDLANIYAKIRFLSFERSFASQFSAKKEEENFAAAMNTAERITQELKTQLTAIDQQLAKETPAADKADLATASALADLASVVISFRRFGHQYHEVAKPMAAAAPGSASAAGPRADGVPTSAQLGEMEKLRNTFTALRTANIQALSRDYRLLHLIAQEVENKDITLIGRWREMLQK